MTFIKRLFDITAIIVNYNTAHLLAEAIGALRASGQGLQLQIVVVDNASRDGSAEIIRTNFADCDLISNSVNVGFGRANNQALPLVQGRYVLLLNTDAFVAPETLSRTAAYMDAHPKCGVLGVRLVGRDGVLQPSCRYFPTPWSIFIERIGIDRFFPGTRLMDDMTWDHASKRECDWVPGCYYLVRASVVDQLISSKALVGGEILSTQLRALKPLFPNGTPIWYSEFSTDASSQLNAAARGDVSVADAIKTLVDQTKALSGG